MDGADLRVERVYLCRHLYDRRRKLYLGCRIVRLAGDGNEWQLAGFRGRLRYGINPGTDHLLPVPKAHDFRFDSAMIDFFSQFVYYI